VDGKLVFYMPYGVWRYNGNEKRLHYPSALELDASGSFVKTRPLFSARDVFKPVDLPRSPAFHTFVRCALPESGALDCEAKSVLASWSREHYVSPEYTFLWSNEHVYAFGMKSFAASAHKASGQPRDQFSFKQVGGTLHVVTSKRTDDYQPLGVELLSLPIAEFDGSGAQQVTSSPLGDGYLMENRFVGDSVFVVTGRFEASTLVVRALGSGATSSRPLVNWVSRIEPLGTDKALVASAARGENRLDLDVYDTKGTVLGGVKLPGLAEGETRSHGFFFKAHGDGGGTFALPVIAERGGWGGVSNIGFYGVAPAGTVSQLGVASSSGDRGVCETSCVDWYGNTRPIFLRDRVFALMGSELAEVKVGSTVEKLGASIHLR
jgi:hypothetical protein